LEFAAITEVAVPSSFFESGIDCCGWLGVPVLEVLQGPPGELIDPGVFIVVESQGDLGLGKVTLFDV
jgi:hypothetical protein